MHLSEYLPRTVKRPWSSHMFPMYPTKIELSPFPISQHWSLKPRARKSVIRTRLYKSAVDMRSLSHSPVSIISGADCQTKNACRSVSIISPRIFSASLLHLDPFHAYFARRFFVGHWVLNPHGSHHLDHHAFQSIPRRNPLRTHRQKKTENSQAFPSMVLNMNANMATNIYFISKKKKKKKKPMHTFQ